MGNKLELIDETPEILNHGKGVTKQTKTYKLDGEKFQIRYENSNGSCMGFNSDMCLVQYSKNDARWRNLEDIKVLGMSQPIPNYYSHESTTHMKEFFRKMEARLEKIYS